MTTHQQARVQSILDCYPAVHPARAAKWLKLWNGQDAALLKALAELVRRYPDKPPNYIHQCLETERKRRQSVHSGRQRNAVVVDMLALHEAGQCEGYPDCATCWLDREGR